MIPLYSDDDLCSFYHCIRFYIWAMIPFCVAIDIFPDIHFIFEAILIVVYWRIRYSLFIHLTSMLPCLYSFNALHYWPYDGRRPLMTVVRLIHSFLYNDTLFYWLFHYSMSILLLFYWWYHSFDHLMQHSIPNVVDSTITFIDCWPDFHSIPFDYFRWWWSIHSWFDCLLWFWFFIPFDSGDCSTGIHYSFYHSSIHSMMIHSPFIRFGDDDSILFYHHHSILRYFHCSIRWWWWLIRVFDIPFDTILFVDWFFIPSIVHSIRWWWWPIIRWFISIVHSTICPFILIHSVGECIVHFDSSFYHSTIHSFIRFDSLIRILMMGADHYLHWFGSDDDDLCDGYCVMTYYRETVFIHSIIPFVPFWWLETTVIYWYHIHSDISIDLTDTLQRKVFNPFIPFSIRYSIFSIRLMTLIDPFDKRMIFLFNDDIPFDWLNSTKLFCWLIWYLFKWPAAYNYFFMILLFGRYVKYCDTLFGQYDSDCWLNSFIVYWW